MDEEGRSDNVLDLLTGNSASDVEVLSVNSSDDVVDSLLVYENSRIAGLGEELGDVLLGGIRGYTLKVYSVGENVLSLLVRELDGVL